MAYSRLVELPLQYEQCLAIDAAAEIGIEGELFVNNDQAIEVLQSIVIK